MPPRDSQEKIFRDAEEPEGLGGAFAHARGTEFHPGPDRQCMALWYKTAMINYYVNDHAHPPRTASAELSHLSVHGSASAAHPDTYLGTERPFKAGGGDVSYQECIDGAASSGGSTVDWQGGALAPQPPRTDSRPTMMKASLLQPGAATVHRRLCIPYEVDENQIPIHGYRTTMTMVLAAFQVDIPTTCSIANLRMCTNVRKYPSCVHSPPSPSRTSNSTFPALSSCCMTTDTLLLTSGPDAPRRRYILMIMILALHIQ